MRYKIGFERRTGCKHVEGRIVSFVRFAKKNAESIDHLLVHSRYTQKIWGLIKEWLGLYFIDLHPWPTKTLKEWWLLIIGPSSTNHKAISSVLLSLRWKFGLKEMLEFFEIRKCQHR
jgi:hypothetical protein